MLLEVTEEQIGELVKRIGAIPTSEWKDIRWIYLDEYLECNGYRGASSKVGRYLGDIEQVCQDLRTRMVEPEWEQGFTTLPAAYEGRSGNGAVVRVLHVRHLLGHWHQFCGGDDIFRQEGTYDFWVLLVNEDVIWHAGERFRSWLVDLTARVKQQMDTAKKEEAQRAQEAAAEEKARRERELLSDL